MNLLFKGRTLVSGEEVVGQGVAPIGGMTFIIQADDRLHSIYRAVHPDSVSIVQERRTTGDRIRGMSDEELAKWTIDITDNSGQYCKSLSVCAVACGNGEDIPLSRCVECMIDYLREVVEE